MSLDIEFSQFEPWKINSKLKDIVREDHLVRFRFTRIIISDNQISAPQLGKPPRLRIVIPGQVFKKVKAHHVQVKFIWNMFSFRILTTRRHTTARIKQTDFK